MNTRAARAGGAGYLDRLVLWPQFTGAEWQLPTEIAVADRLLVGWRFMPDPVDAGPPPTVAALLVGALQKHATLTFASALRPTGGSLLARRWKPGRNFVWTTSASVDEAAQGIFNAGFFPWNLQGQVAILGGPGLPPALDERYLQLLSEPGLFGEVKSAGALGVLLPGVDGAVAGLYFFNVAVAGSVRSELDNAVRAAGGRCVVATGEDFRVQLRG